MWTTNLNGKVANAVQLDSIDSRGIQVAYHVRTNVPTEHFSTMCMLYVLRLEADDSLCICG